jgi:hypothetical protein
MRIPAEWSELKFESAFAAQLRLSSGMGALPGEVSTNRVTFGVDSLPADRVVTLSQRSSRPVWARLVDAPAESSWLTSSEFDRSAATPDAALTARLHHPVVLRESSQNFIPGRFGQAALIVPGRELHIPDEVPDASGVLRRISDARQGTIEFWVRRYWDDRLAAVPRFELLDNGEQGIAVPWPLPVDEWAHVAVTWRPAPHDAAQTLVHIHVNGMDPANYRNLSWEGYGDRPPGFGKPGQWLQKWIASAPPGFAFALDDLRISSRPRYADLEVALGAQHTANPVRFAPPDRPAEMDEFTTLWLPLDGTLEGQARDNQRIAAAWHDRER